MLTLLLTYNQKRKDNLVELIDFFSKNDDDIQILIIEGSEKPTLKNVKWLDPRITYYFVESAGIFHKTKMLNIGLSHAKMKYVIPYDVDLIPINSSLSLAVKLAEASPKILVTGYRLMCPDKHYDGNTKKLKVAQEDVGGSLKRYLLSAHRFGVCPVFNRSRLNAIGGWDEKFKGWGAEDQDLIERYCGSEFTVAKFQDLIYIHLFHEISAGWNDKQLTRNNRKYYKEKHIQQKEVQK
jgi:predicted glycosyltransferase involved in capsule biosynthesis